MSFLLKINNYRKEVYQFGIYIVLIKTIYNIVHKFCITKIDYFIANIKHKTIIKWLEKNFHEEISNYHYTKNISNATITKQIWQLWWQGTKEMPDIIKLCTQSVVRHNPQFKYHLIDQYNFNKYVDIPQHILALFHQGKINITFLSDYIRMLLLKKYGGIWIDTTVFMKSKLDDSIFNYRFYSVKDNHRSIYISKDRWSTWFIASQPNSIISDFCCYFYEKYYEKKTSPIDYFLFDYIFEIGVRNISLFKHLINTYPINNKSKFYLQKKINEPKKCIAFTDDTYIFKLNRKQKYIKSNEQGQTFFGFLLDQYVNNKNSLQD